MKRDGTGVAGFPAIFPMHIFGGRGRGELARDDSQFCGLRVEFEAATELRVGSARWLRGDSFGHRLVLSFSFLEMARRCGGNTFLGVWCG